MENLDNYKNLSEIVNLLGCSLETYFDKLNDKLTYYLVNDDGEELSQKMFSIQSLDTYCKVNKKQLLSDFSEDDYSKDTVSIKHFDDEY
jgi:hypothetical protein